MKTESRIVGKNHPGGVMIHFFVKDTTQAKISLEIFDNADKLVRKFSNKPDKKAKDGELKLKPGMNRFVWDMRYPDAEGFDGIILWAARLTGPLAAPGNYKARLSVNDNSATTLFQILKDPRTSGTAEDVKEQFDFLTMVNAKLSETNTAIRKIRTARDQITRVTEPLKDKPEMKDVNDASQNILDEMTRIEEALYQTKNKSGQDPLNYPVRLNNKLAALAYEASLSDYKPTTQVKAVYKEITGQIDEQLNALKKVFEESIPQFNELVRSKKINAVTVGE
jgi:hypothetical protein